MTDQAIHGTNMTLEDAEKMNRTLSQQRSQEIKKAVPKGEMQWSTYGKK
jgi:Mn-containing catalase